MTTANVRAVRQKATVLVLIGVFVLVAAACDSNTEPDETTAAAPSSAAEPETSSLPAGSVEPGRYIFVSSDPGLDASHVITVDVPEGYCGFDGVAALRCGSSQTSVSTLAIGDVYANACQWEGTLLDRSEISSVDGVVAALTSQEGLRVSTPSAVTVDGFAGTYLERRVPGGTDTAQCDLGQFRVYSSPGFGERYLERGQLDLLWILDVDGVPLVIDAAIEAGTPAEVRAELLQMVDSVQIDARPSA